MDDTTLYPTADAEIQQGNPDSNYGGAATLSVTSRTGALNRRSFLKFDLSSIPAGSTITLAKLRANCFLARNLIAGVTDVEARRVADDTWTELGITWTNQPPYGVVEDTKVPAVGWVEWDITSFVQAEFAGDKTVTICLKSETESYDATFRDSYYRSKEYDNLDPELYIEYTAPKPCPVILFF